MFHRAAEQRGVPQRVDRGHGVTRCREVLQRNRPQSARSGNETNGAGIERTARSELSLRAEAQTGALPPRHRAVSPQPNPHQPPPRSGGAPATIYPSRPHADVSDSGARERVGCLSRLPAGVTGISDRTRPNSRTFRRAASCLSGCKRQSGRKEDRFGRLKTSSSFDRRCRLTGMDCRPRAGLFASRLPCHPCPGNPGRLLYRPGVPSYP